MNLLAINVFDIAELYVSSFKLNYSRKLEDIKNNDKFGISDTRAQVRLDHHKANRITLLSKISALIKNPLVIAGFQKLHK